MTTLISARTGSNVGAWEESGLAGGYNWILRKYELDGGRQDGVEVLVVNNGFLRFTIVPTRGMGLWDARARDVRLGWDAPCREIVHPKYIDLESRGGLGWLEGFGEWIVRCGLENNGGPTVDTVLDNNGNPQQMHLPLHGKIANIPASELSVEVSSDPMPVITVKGKVIEGFLFGTNLILETTITTKVGSESVTVHDRVINNSETPSEFELLYHCNYGPPVLEEGSHFVAPLKRVTPRDARAAETGVENFHVYGGPQAGTTEQCYFLSLYGDNHNNTATLLRNASGNKGVLQRWNLDQLPCCTLWKNTQGLRDGYVTGIEPGTDYPNGRNFERDQGRLLKLDPGAFHDATVTYVALTDDEAVAQAEFEVANILGNRDTQMDEGPVESICG